MKKRVLALGGLLCAASALAAPTKVMFFFDWRFRCLLKDDKVRLPMFAKGR